MAENLERQLALLSLLCASRAGASFEEIRKKLPSFYGGKAFEAAKKLFDRDKRELLELGLPLVTQASFEDGAKERYSLAEAARMGNEDLRLSLEEAGALRRALADPLIRDQLPGVSRQVLSRLLCFHAPFDEEGLGEDGEGDLTTAQVLRVRQAIEAGQALEMEYPNAQGRVERRTVSPWGIYLRWGQAYMVAGCHRDKTQKVFSLSKVRRLENTSEPAMPKPGDFDLRQMARRTSFQFEEGGPMEVFLQVDAKEAFKLKERQAAAIVEEKEGQGVTARFVVRSPRRFWKFVLDFGPHAEVVGPPEARKAFHRFLTEGR